MNKRIVFRHMEHSASLENYVNQQLSKVENFLSHVREPITIDVVLTGQKDHAHHEVECHVTAPHYELFSKHEGPDMYDVIDRVIDTIYKRLLEAKEKNNDDERKKDFFKGA